MAREAAGERRRPPVRSADPAPELAGLDLAQLRAYREALAAEEEAVSYWRRIIHGRMDLLEAQAGSEGSLSLADLVRVLGDTGSGRSRRALMSVPAPTQLPDLPDMESLAHLWSMDPHGPDDLADVVERLRGKERQLSEYRSALHERIDRATAELIVRYRADPRAALDLLPTP